MKKVKVGVALSGGVDSTSTAIMLREEYNVTGFFMQLAQPDIEQQLDRVTKTAVQIGIPLKVIDLHQQFDDKIISYFCSTYFSGRTPNPCIVCNKLIKFGLFLDSILSSGMEKVATGHYAKVYDDDGTYRLAKGEDKYKDQSYFLSRLSQRQLSKILFPLGTLKKEKVFEYAEKHGFPSFRGQESQDVCFLANTSVSEFLTENTRDLPLPGQIIDEKGNRLGTHRGIFHYTIGQRRGLGVSGPHPYYVIDIDFKKNTITVGRDKKLLRKKVNLSDVHWITGHPPDFSSKYTIKIRYTHSGSTAQVHPNSDTTLTVIFDEPQRAITPGQFGVIYHGDQVLGSGEIV